MLSLTPSSEPPSQTPERHRQGTTGGRFDRLQGQPAARRAWPGWAGAAHLRPTRSAGTDPLSVPAATQTIPAPALHWPGSRRRALWQLRAGGGSRETGLLSRGLQKLSILSQSSYWSSLERPKKFSHDYWTSLRNYVRACGVIISSRDRDLFG